MAINFPTSLDNFTNPSSGNTLDSPSHSLQHSDINDAVEALEAKLGVGASPAGSASAGQVLTASTGGTTTWSTPTPGALVQIVPSSVSVGSGSGSADANGKVTFTGVSSISLNNVFSATYDSYKIILDLTAVSGDLVLYMRMRASAADNSGTAYSLGYNYRSRAGSSSGYNNNDATFWGILQGSGNELGHNYVASIDITSPALAQRTVFGANGYTAQGTDDVMYGFSGGGMHSVETAYDGFSLITSTGTVTGRVSVYGYR